MKQYLNAQALQKDQVKHKILVVKINKLYKKNMSPEALYNAVRGNWSTKLARAQQVDYVFGVYEGVIVAVYKPTQWGKKPDERVYFKDADFENMKQDQNKEFYLGKSIENFEGNLKTRNPVSYIN